MTIGSSFGRLAVGVAVTVASISLAAPATPGGTIQPMKESGEGTLDVSASGCVGSVDTCEKLTADAQGRPIDGGSLVLKFGFDTNEFFQNPRGKSCVDVVGEGRFRKGPNKIFISVEGPFCKASAGSYMKLYYEVTGGDGRFDGAHGRGGIFMRVRGETTYHSGGTLKF